MLITEDKEIDIFVASKIGSFKHIKYYSDSNKNTKKCIENLVDIKSLQKDDSVIFMTWGNEEQTEILIGRKNQQFQTYSTQRSEFTNTYTADFGTGHIVGLGRHKRKLLAALSTGIVKVYSKKEEDIVNVGGKIDRMRMCSDDGTLFATGGEENELRIWRIGETEPTFVAKNLPNDWLQLRRPVWVSDLTFLPGEGGNLVAVCSRHGYVRLYDTRAQRRPVCNVDFEAMAATCIAPSFEERKVLVGFGRGQLQQVDLRSGKPDKAFKGCAGAVSDVTVHRRNRLIVSTSLDRYIRIHSYADKSMVYKQYLTSKLTSVLVQTEANTPLELMSEVELKDEEVKVEDDEMEQIFGDMKTVGETKKKHLSEATPSDSKKLKPSTEGSTDAGVESTQNTDEAIFKLLKSTEKQKKRIEKRKKEKRAKSVFYNA